MAHDVFISYSHKDKTVADAICARLEQDGVRCWYAPRDIAPGMDWAAAIIEAIEETKVMVLVFTDFSNASRQVLREINNAVRTGAVIVPFRLTDSAPSGGMKYYLSTVHWLDAMTGPLDRNISRLSDLVRAILQETPLPASGLSGIPEDVSAEKPPKKSAKPVLIAAAALLTAAAVLFAVRGRAPAEESGTPVPEATEETAEQTAEPVSAPTADPTATASASGNAEKNTGVSGGYMYEISRGKVTLQKYLGTDQAQIEIPDSIEGMAVTGIGEKCFHEHTEIETVVFPATLETIGYQAFYGCKNLKQLDLPEGLRTIEGWAFAHSGLTDVVLPASVTKLGYGAFYSCISLVSAVLPEQVDDLGENTFRLCYRLKTVTITAPEPSIDLMAFDDGGRVTIIGVPGSFSETYAAAMNLKFEALDPDGTAGQEP